MDLEEIFTFDYTEKSFCVGICLVVVCQILNVIVIVEAFCHQLFARARIHGSSLTILQWEPSSLLEIQLESTALLA